MGVTATQGQLEANKLIACRPFELFAEGTTYPVGDPKRTALFQEGIDLFDDSGRIGAVLSPVTRHALGRGDSSAPSEFPPTLGPSGSLKHFKAMMWAAGQGKHPRHGTMPFQIYNVVAEGDQVVAQMYMNGTLLNGDPYKQVYIFVFRIRDGKIAEFTECADTKYAFDLQPAESWQESDDSREFRSAVEEYMTTH